MSAPKGMKAEHWIVGGCAAVVVGAAGAFLGLCLGGTPGAFLGALATCIVMAKVADAGQRYCQAEMADLDVEMEAQRKFEAIRRARGRG